MSGSFLTRLVACLVAVVAVLQLVHLVLLNQLETRRLEEISHLQRDLQPSQKNEREVAQPLRRTQLEVTRRENIDLNENEILHRLSTSAVLDSSGKYSISYNIAGPKKVANTRENDALNPLPLSLSKRDNEDFLIDEDEDSHPSSDSHSITLVSWNEGQSLERKLVPLLDRWQGPISLVLYTSNSSASSVNELIHSLVKARACSELVKNFVTFHVVLPGSNKGVVPGRKYNSKRKMRKQDVKGSGIAFSHSTNPEIFECSDLLGPDPEYKDLGNLQSNASSSESGTRVPINLLRNVGRKGVQSDYFLESPIDLLPSWGIRERFQKMLKSRQSYNYNDVEERVVYVLPSFEIKSNDGSYVPIVKSEMVRLVRNYEARPYGFEACWKCQVRTDYDSWYRSLDRGKGQPLSTLYEVLWKDPWSPFFIAPIQSPQFPEEFDSSSHLSSISHLCELHTAGYKFAVLNEAFLVHLGYRKGKEGLGERSSEGVGEKSKFKSFKAELRNKYPHSTRRCY